MTNFEIYTHDYDNVIDSYFLTGKCSYRTAIDSLYPLINRFADQRKIQNEKFYKRLETDLLDGCIMPPLTIAFVTREKFDNQPIAAYKDFIEHNISNGFILDGIQRLNTLNRVADDEHFEDQRPIFLNFIICPSRDNLLYRMVTLNNGQKPMTARHQIEILASNIYDFNSIGIELLSEKESASSRNPKAFKKSDVISAYIAFLSDTPNLENNKIIEEKMDELIARKIIESKITKDGIEFYDVLNEISRLSENEYNHRWLKNNNNLVGFCLGIKKSIKTIMTITPSEFEKALVTFEETFADFDVSKIKLSRERRKISRFFIEEYQQLQHMDSYDLLLAFNEIS
jgi:hypothetical protein